MEDARVDPAVSRRMSTTRGRDTKPELEVRSLLHGRGLRYRVNHRVLLGSRRTVDIAFPKEHVAVFIDGCFWHGCPTHFVIPKTRTEFWVEKIATNQQRDADSSETLGAAGWTVLRFWEHEDPVEVAGAIEAQVLSLRERGPSAR